MKELAKKQSIRFISSVIFIFVLFAGVFIYSCRHEISQPEEILSVNEAQSWFESQPNSAVQLKSGGAKRLEFKNDWKHAHTDQNDTLGIVEVNVLAKGRIGYLHPDGKRAMDSTGNDKYLNSLTRLIIQKNKRTGRIESFVMTLIASPEYMKKNNFDLSKNTYLKKQDDFTGFVYYNTIRGHFVNGWKFNDGKVVGKCKQLNGDNSGVVLKSAEQVSTCITYYTPIYQQDCTDWYDGYSGAYMYTTCSPWYYVGTAIYEVCDPAVYDGGGGNGGGNGGYTPPTNDCYGVNGGTAYLDECGNCVGGTTGKLPCVPCTGPTCQKCGKLLDLSAMKSANAACEYCTCIIIDGLNNYPCGQKALNMVLNANSAGLGKILYDVFGVNKKLNLTFRPKVMSSDDGEFNGPASSPGNYVVDINTYVLNNSSQPYIAATLLHEGLHAYFAYNATVDPNFRSKFPCFGINSSGSLICLNSKDSEHEYMTKYVNAIANSLVNCYPKLSQSQAIELSWGGLQQTQAYKLNKDECDKILPNAFQNSIIITNQSHRTSGCGNY